MPYFIIQEIWSYSYYLRHSNVLKYFHSRNDSKAKICSLSSWGPYNLMVGDKVHPGMLSQETTMRSELLTLWKSLAQNSKLTLVEKVQVSFPCPLLDAALSMLAGSVLDSLPWWQGCRRAGRLTQLRVFSWPTPTSTPLMNGWRGEGAGPTDPKMQDIHNTEQQLDMWEESPWGSSTDSVAEARGLEGTLCSVWHTTASTARLFFFCGS